MTSDNDLQQLEDELNLGVTEFIFNSNLLEFLNKYSISEKVVFEIKILQSDKLLSQIRTAKFDPCPCSPPPHPPGGCMHRITSNGSPIC